MITTVTPVRRDLQFHLPPERIADWHSSGPHVSYFFNALSLFFPDGERFFIDSVRHYLERLDDSELKQQVRGFIGQEAMHGREHERYNAVLKARGMPVDRYLRFINFRLNMLRRYTPVSWQLAITIALEHLTAILAAIVLREPRSLAKCEPHYAALWRWHALEETEHKAVAFDVYQATVGGGLRGYLRRCVALLLSSTLFLIFASAIQVGMLYRERQLFKPRAGLSAINFLWGRPGVLRRILLDWFDFLRPGFHPWDHDNSEKLQQLPAVIEEISSIT